MQDDLSFCYSAIESNFDGQVSLKISYFIDFFFSKTKFGSVMHATMSIFLLLLCPAMPGLSWASTKGHEVYISCNMLLVSVYSAVESDFDAQVTMKIFVFTYFFYQERNLELSFVLPCQFYCFGFALQCYDYHEGAIKYFMHCQLNISFAS